MRPRRHEEHELNRAAYLLGALTELESEVFERHLMGCSDCREDLEYLSPGIVALARSVEPLEPPPELRAKLLQALEHEEADVSAAAPAAGAPEPAERRGSDRRLWRGAGGHLFGALLRPRAALAGVWPPSRLRGASASASPSTSLDPGRPAGATRS
jgi:anti-sigma factor RsiW